jgi:hypothetical protein
VEIAALTAFLAPFLGRFLKPVGDAAGDMAEKLGDAAVEQAKALWARLQGKVAAKPSAQEAAEDVAKAPDDPDAQAALRLQLKKILDEDPDLANQIRQIWDQAKDDPEVRTIVSASGERSVAVGRDVRGGNISTGDSPAP